MKQLSIKVLALLVTIGTLMSCQKEDTFVITDSQAIKTPTQSDKTFDFGKDVDINDITLDTKDTNVKFVDTPCDIVLEKIVLHNRIKVKESGKPFTEICSCFKDNEAKVYEVTINNDDNNK